MDNVRSVDEAAEAEAAGAESRPAAGERNPAPWWYYLVVGAVVGAATVVILLAPGLPAGIAVLVMVVSNPLLEALRRRISGEPPPAFRRPALPYTVGGIVLALGTLGLGLSLVHGLGLTWAAWLVGAVMFAVIVVFAWLADRAPR
jgi:uncharacterized membrane protein YphA (DoxX/SURF4 family)